MAAIAPRFFRRAASLALSALLFSASTESATTDAIVRTCDVPRTARTMTSADAILERLPRDISSRLSGRGWVMQPSGEVLGTGCGTFVRGFVIFDPPRENVMTMLIQTHRQAEFLPRGHDIRPVVQRSNLTIDQHTVRVVFMALRYHVRTEWDRENHRMWWSLDPGYDNSFTALRGYWQLHDMEDGRTLAEYVSRVDVGRVLPASVQARLTDRSVRDALGHVRMWVNAGGEHRR